MTCVSLWIILQMSLFKSAKLCQQILLINMKTFLKYKHESEPWTEKSKVSALMRKKLGKHPRISPKRFKDNLGRLNIWEDIIFEFVFLLGFLFNCTKFHSASTITLIMRLTNKLIEKVNLFTRMKNSCRISVKLCWKNNGDECISCF